MASTYYSVPPFPRPFKLSIEVNLASYLLKNSKSRSYTTRSDSESEGHKASRCELAIALIYLWQFYIASYVTVSWH